VIKKGVLIQGELKDKIIKYIKPKAASIAIYHTRPFGAYYLNTG